VALGARRRTGRGVRTPPRREALLAILLFSLAAALFWPIREHAFLNYDDDHYITREPGLRLGVGAAGLAWALTSSDGANWFPATRLSWLVDSALFGLDPRAFHTTDLLLHALATALLFLALARMTQSPWRSAFVAAVFAVHPLHVEAVAWASGRKDPLSAVAFGAALLFASGARARAPTRAERAGVLACLALGLGAKPTLVTLPFVLLLLDMWPLGRLGRSGDPTRIDAQKLRRALLEKLPLLALVVAECVVVVLAQRAGGAIIGLAQIPFGARIANALVACASYLRLTFWPVDLAVLYPHPASGIGLGQATLAFALLLVVTLAAGAAWRRRPYLLIGWLWFLGMLVPTLGLVQVGAQAMADRYMYLPLTGLAIAVAWGVPDLLATLPIPPRARRNCLALAAIASIAALGAASSAQLRFWRDSETLFRHTLAVTRENAIAHAQLGDALLERGRAAEALAQWEESLRLLPNYLEVANNLAWLLATTPIEAMRDPARAVAVAERARAIAERPEVADPAELASVLDTLAAAQAAAGRFADAARTASESHVLALRSGDTGLAAEVAERGALYRAGRTYTEP
jgi:hypothetical protein